jgi:hypothetical protein
MPAQQELYLQNEEGKFIFNLHCWRLIDAVSKADTIQRT